MKDKKVGKITRPANLKPESHEIATAEFLANRGYDIEFLMPNYTKGAKTPDIQMSGILWEIKSPHGNGKHTLRHALHKAFNQSQNIIFDLRRIKLSDKECISQIQYHLKSVKYIKRFLVITKSHQLLDIKK